jgi:phosphoketolase
MSTQPMSPLEPDLLGRMDAYWRPANYLSVGQTTSSTTRSPESRGFSQP